MIIRFHDPHKNKLVVVGELTDGIFIKKVNRKKHYLRVAKGYAIQKSVVEMLIENDCKEIKIVENKNRVLSIAMDTFLKKVG